MRQVTHQGGEYAWPAGQCLQYHIKNAAKVHGGLLCGKRNQNIMLWSSCLGLDAGVPDQELCLRQKGGFVRQSGSTLTSEQ